MTGTDITGFIGLGQVGQPIALNLLKAGARQGFDLRVFDLRQERIASLVACGAHQAFRPREAFEMGARARAARGDQKERTPGTC